MLLSAAEQLQNKTRTIETKITYYYLKVFFTSLSLRFFFSDIRPVPICACKMLESCSLEGQKVAKKIAKKLLSKFLDIFI